MTIKELRQEFQKTVKQAERMTGKNSNLVNYYKTEWATLETLYAEGAVNRRTDYISDDMLALATGYDPQKTDDGFTVVRCLDLAYIYATKKHVRNMMMIFLGLEKQEEEQAEPEEQTTEEQQQPTTEHAKRGNPKKYREIIDMIIQASGTDAEVSEICSEIDLAFQHEKIKLKEYNQLYALINKIF